MKIAIDYDDTYNTDPTLWQVFSQLAQARGHEIHIVTWRYPKEKIQPMFLHKNANVHYTGRMAKKEFMDNLGIDIDIWVDDNPAAILEDMLVVDNRPMCMACSIGRLDPFFGRNGKLDILYSICDECGLDICTPTQTRINKLIKLGSEVDGR